MLDVAREIDARHAAATNLAFDLIPSAQSLRNRRVTIVDEQPREPLGDRTVEHWYRALALVDKPLDFSPKAWVVPAQHREHGRPQLSRRIEDSVNER